MRLLLLGSAGIVVLIGTTLAVAQQIEKIDDKVLKNAGKGTEWTMNGMDWGEQRYSTLTQINAGNVGKLEAAWSYELGVGGGNQQATPLFSNGVLYTVTNWSIVAAVDAKTGKELWHYDPLADRTMTQPGKSRLCCGVNSRGIALYEGKVLVPVVDGRMQALDAATGKLLWSSWAIPEPKEGDVSSYSLTMAARVAKGVGEELPRQHAGEDQNGIGYVAFRRKFGDPAEDQGEDQNRQQRPDQAPRHADDRLLVAHQNIAPR